jgi:uncharacterized spore protein YtfJ
MERERVTIGDPVAIAGTTLIPVVKSSFKCQLACGGIFFSGIKQPISIVVASPAVKKAFDVTGEEISLNQLIQEAPSLAGILE